MTDPGPVYDSRAWTGDIPAPEPKIRPKGKGPLPPRYIWLALALFLSIFLFFLLDALIWYIAGEPTMFFHDPTNHTLGLSALVGLASAFLLRRAVAEDLILGVGGLGFGMALIIVHESCFFIDRANAKPIGGGTIFVNGVRWPGFGRNHPLRPTARVESPYWRAELIGPPSDLGTFVPGDTCLDIAVSRGPNGATFVQAHVRSSGDGTGSWMVADANRARCLGG
jgi:hypothetical protein